MFKKIFLFLIILLIILFFYFIVIYYFSEENIRKINLSRTTIQENFDEKYSNLPFLDNDTNNVIEFNTGLNLENKVKRNFWDLIKKK